MIKKTNNKYIPNVVRGGVAKPLGNNYFLMKGRKHKEGGIDIGENPKTGLEVEGGEVVKADKNGIRVWSAVPFLNGESPAKRVLNGENPNKVFKAQESYKKRNGINDDGSRKAKYGLNEVTSASFNIGSKRAKSVTHNNNKVSGYSPFIYLKKMGGNHDKTKFKQTKEIYKDKKAMGGVYTIQANGKSRLIFLPLRGSENSQSLTRDKAQFGTYKKAKIGAENKESSDNTRVVINKPKIGKGKSISKKGKTVIYAFDANLNKIKVGEGTYKDSKGNVLSEVYQDFNGDIHASDKACLRANGNYIIKDKRTRPIDSEYLDENGNLKPRELGVPWYIGGPQGVAGRVAAGRYSTVKVAARGYRTPRVTPNRPAKNARFTPTGAILTAGLIDAGDNKNKKYYAYQYKNGKWVKDKKVNNPKFDGYYYNANTNKFYPKAYGSITYTNDESLEKYLSEHPDKRNNANNSNSDNSKNNANISANIKSSANNTNEDSETLYWQDADGTYGKQDKRVSYQHSKSPRGGYRYYNLTKDDLDSGHYTGTFIHTRNDDGKWEDRKLEDSKENKYGRRVFKSKNGVILNDVWKGKDGKYYTSKELADKTYENNAKDTSNNNQTNSSETAPAANDKGTATHVDKGSTTTSAAKDSTTVTTPKADTTPATKGTSSTKADTTNSNASVASNTPTNKRSNTSANNGTTSAPVNKKGADKQTNNTIDITAGLNDIVRENTANDDNFFYYLYGRPIKGKKRITATDYLKLQNPNIKGKSPIVDDIYESADDDTNPLDDIVQAPDTKPANFKIALKNKIEDIKISLKNKIKNIKNYASEHPDVIEDAVGLTSNVVGSLITNKINKDMLNNQLPTPEPVYLTPRKLKTTININPQLDAMRESAKDYERSMNNNVASSRTALSRIQDARNSMLANVNSVYTDKINKETDLINNDINNQQDVAKSNIDTYNNYVANETARKNLLAEKLSENNVNTINNINAGIQDVISRRQQARNTKNTILAMIAGYNNLPIELFPNQVVDERTKSAYRKAVRREVND